METAKPKFCESCGKPLVPGSRFCEECGRAVEAEPPAPNSPLPPPAPPAQVPPPAFVQPPVSPVAPSAVPAVPKPQGGSGCKIAAVIVLVVVLLLGGVGIIAVFAGKQLLSRFAGSPRPDIPALPVQLPTPAPDVEQAPQPTPAPQAAPVIITATEQAQEWVDKGYAAEGAGNLQEAIANYEEALKFTQDGDLADHIQELKQSMSQPATVAPPTSRVQLTEQMMQAAKTIYSRGNIYAVENGAKRPNTFTVSEPVLITYISTYHWNNGKGKPPGAIALEHADGTKYGEWSAKGINGQGGVPNASWVVVPGIVIKPGQYTLFDSHPPTWSQNPGTGGQGMCEIKGLPWSQVSGWR